MSSSEEPKKEKSQIQSAHSRSQSKTMSNKSDSQMQTVRNTRGTVGIDTGEKQNKHTVRKFFHKLKEKAGMVEKTEYPQALQDQFTDLDEYKLVLDNLAESLCQFIQLNPEHRKVGDPAMKLDAPPRQDEYEQVADWLKKNKTNFGTYKNYENVVKGIDTMALIHREYQMKSRKALHNVRTFLKHDYWLIGNHRRELEQHRVGMDFNKAQLKGTKDAEMIEQRGKLVDEATKTYEDKLKEVTQMMAQLPKQKECHMADVADWAKTVQQFHDKASRHLATIDLK